MLPLQVFDTVGDKKGGTYILFDPSISPRGALVYVARAPRKKSIDDFEAQPVIHNSLALPLFRDQPSYKWQREKALKDPLKSHKPEVPVTGTGFGRSEVVCSRKPGWKKIQDRPYLKYADVAARESSSLHFPMHRLSRNLFSPSLIQRRKRNERVE